MTISSINKTLTLFLLLIFTALSQEAKTSLTLDKAILDYTIIRKLNIIHPEAIPLQFANISVDPNQINMKVLNQKLKTIGYQLILDGDNLFLEKIIYEKFQIQDKETEESIESVELHKIDGEFLGFSDPDGFLRIADMYKTDFPIILSHTSYKNDTINYLDHLNNQSYIYLLSQIEEDDVLTVSSKFNSKEIRIKNNALHAPVQLENNANFIEADVLKDAFKLPGISMITPNQSELSIRGSYSGESLILYDGEELINPYHLNGRISAMNSYHFKEFAFYADAAPIAYSNNFAGIIDLKSREPNKDESMFYIHQSNFSTSLSAEGPALGGSHILSTRYFFWNDISNDDKFPYSFFDINLKSQYELGRNDILSLTAFYALDLSEVKTKLTENAGTENERIYDNGTINRTSNTLLAGLNWKHDFTNSISMKNKVVFNMFHGDGDEWSKVINDIKHGCVNCSYLEPSKLLAAHDSFSGYGKYINELNLQNDNWNLNLGLSLKRQMNTGISRYIKVPASVGEVDSSYNVFSPDKIADYSSVYIDGKIKLNNVVSIDAGISTLSSDLVIQTKINYKLYAYYQYDESIKLNIGMRRNSRFEHLFSSFDGSYRFNLNDNVNAFPTIHQYSIGLQKIGKNYLYDMTLYFKKFNHLLSRKAANIESLEYSRIEDLLFNENKEDLGFDLILQKRFNNTLLSYTLNGNYNQKTYYDSNFDKAKPFFNELDVIGKKDPVYSSSLSITHSLTEKITINNSFFYVSESQLQNRVLREYYAMNFRISHSFLDNSEFYTQYHHTNQSDFVDDKNMISLGVQMHF